MFMLEMSIIFGVFRASAVTMFCCEVVLVKCHQIFVLEICAVCKAGAVTMFCCSRKPSGSFRRKTPSSECRFVLF